MSIAEHSVVPKTLDEAIRYAQLLADSDMIPKDYQGKPANVLLAMQMGMEVGLPPVQALQGIGKVGNKPAMWGDAPLAVVQTHPKFEDIQEWVEKDEDGNPTRGVCRIKRAGRDWVEREFTYQDAERAGLIGKTDIWSGYLGRMLQMRARAFAIRDTFSDALKGLSVAEEVMDIPTTEPVMETGDQAEPDPIADLKRKIGEEEDQGPPATTEQQHTGGEQTTHDAARSGSTGQGDEGEHPKDVPDHVQRRGELIDRMKAAESLEALEALRPEAEQLPSHDGSRSMAGQAYKERKRELVEQASPTEEEAPAAAGASDTASSGAEGAFGHV